MAVGRGSDWRVWNTAAASRLAAFSLHLSDIKGAEDGMALLNDLVNKRVWDASTSEQRAGAAHTIFEGVVFGYCRCFDPTRKANRLDVNEVLAGNTKAQKFHEELWAMRSKHYAHDVNGYRDALVAVRVDDGSNKIDVLRFKMEPDESVVRNMARLLRDARSFVEAEVSRLASIVENELSSVAKAERAALPEAKFSLPRSMTQPRK
jgi:hypothetical protein